MPRATTNSLPKLPHLPETWQIAIAQLRIWITPSDQAPYRPYVILILSLERGAIRALEITGSQPRLHDVRDTLFKAMHRPAPGSGVKGIPHTILVPDSKVADALIPFLAEARFKIDILERPSSDQVAQIIQDLEEHLRSGPEQPAMLSVEGVTPELVSAFFAAAAEFYRAAPWVHLNNYQVLALRHPAESNYRYTVVMGQAGVEYGLATYLSWEDVEKLYTTDEGLEEAIPAHGAYSLFYGTINWMPFGDLEALQKLGWEVAAENAYPIAMVFEKGGRVRRPAPIDLLWYEAALRAIPILLRDYLKPDGRGDYQPLEREIEVPMHTGSVRIAVKYPAGQTPLAEQPVQRTRWSEFEDEEEGGEALPFFDRRAMERTMQEIAQQMGAKVGSGDADLDRAQALMYQAFEEANPAKRIALAHDALAISPNCADAYVLLAEEEADTVGRALELYQQGVAAGERALGAEFFKENAGHFWGLLETRPYMRARRGLADALWRVGQKEEALAHYRELLRLNPNDNQGNRYLLADLLLQMDRFEGVAQLLDQYPDEWSAAWLYTRALVKFRQQGASKQADKALRDALEENPHVPAYLTGRKRIPNRLPEYIGYGDEREAIAYAADHLNYWRRTPGAVEWLCERIQMKRLKYGANRQQNRATKKR